MHCPSFNVRQTWLLGYEFPSVLSLITKEKIVFVMSSGKGAPRTA